MPFDEVGGVVCLHFDKSTAWCTDVSPLSRGPHRDDGSLLFFFFYFLLEDHSKLVSDVEERFPGKSIALLAEEHVY